MFFSLKFTTGRWYAIQQFSTSSSCLTYDINMNPETSVWNVIKSYSPWLMKNVLPPFVSEGKLNFKPNYVNVTVDFPLGEFRSQFEDFTILMSDLDCQLFSASTRSTSWTRTTKRTHWFATASQQQSFSSFTPSHAWSWAETSTSTKIYLQRWVVKSSEKSHLGYNSIISASIETELGGSRQKSGHLLRRNRPI